MRQGFRVVVMSVPVLAAVACQGPPPVGRAADPVQRGAPSDGESADLMRRVDDMQAQLKAAPKDARLLVALGKLYYDNERYPEAATHFRQALDQRPSDAEAAKMLGVCLFMLGNPDEAAKMQEAALASVPNDVDALFFVGAIVLNARPQDKDALKRAREAWEKFLELAPTHPRAAEIRSELEQVRKAERGEITLGRPERAAAEERAEAPPAGGTAPAAARKGTRVPALPKDAKPLDRKRAEALDAIDEQRYFDAREAAEVVLQALPTDDEMQVVQARAMVQMGEGPAAIKKYGEVIKRNPRFSPAWHFLGMAYMLGGDGKQAAATWRDLIRMDPEYARQNRLEQRAAMAENMGGGN
ncbi:MAG: tetratricopeptide repeat protein [Deltaproteobacteria bacterium]|nr:tetratricopeptide repeat protein [Deltaproteobacteria bacterium]